VTGFAGFFSTSNPRAWRLRFENQLPECPVERMARSLERTARSEALAAF